MTRYFCAAILFASLLIVGGCGGQSGTTTISFQPGQKLSPLSTVITPARYALYSSDSVDPTWSEELNIGDEYGFVMRADGNIYGVAKGQDIALAAQSKAYLWKRQDLHPASSGDD